MHGIKIKIFAFNKYVISLLAIKQMYFVFSTEAAPVFLQKYALLKQKNIKYVDIVMWRIVSINMSSNIYSYNNLF